MPYHIFEIDPFKQARFLESKSAYRDAKLRVRELRRSGKLLAGTTVRMIFAADPSEAKKLLAEKREPRPMGEFD
jgi:hypothetical protein